MAQASALFPAGDMPFASSNDSSPTMAAMLCRVQGEFLEMPGLCLTEAQARCGPWTPRGVPRCIAAGFLFRTRDGAFMRTEQTRSVTIGLASSAPARPAA